MPEVSERILVVDDDEGKRYTTTRHLRAVGFEVTEASTGAEGLALVQALPDLVVLDMKLPDIDGLQVCRQIKRAPATSAVLVLALSARFTSAPDRARGLEYGADGYLVHPVDGDELIATVRALLRLRRAERERQRLAGALELEERRYQTITETTTVGLCLVDPQGCCTFLNRAAETMLVRDGASAVGRPLHEVLDPQTLEGTRIPTTEWSVTRMLAGEALAPSSRQVVQDAHGGRLTIELSANLIIVAGAAVGAVVEVKDIEQLVRAERQRDLFLAALGHDLRGPLQTLSMGATVLLDSPNISETDATTLSRMITSAERMERMIAHILTFARTLVGRVPLEPHPTDLVQICTTLIRDANAREPSRRIDLFGPAELTGLWDADRLNQVVENLLGNAVRHGHGVVTIAVEREAEQALLTIHNGGTPIPLAAMSTLFDPFRRASEHRNSVGLGLYIVDQLVRAHDGSVTVTSNAEAGTAFRVRLPLASRATSNGP